VEDTYRFWRAAICIATGTLTLALSHLASAVEGYSYIPGAGTVIFSDDPSLFRVALPISYVEAAIKKKIIDGTSDGFKVNNANGTFFAFFSDGADRMQLEVRFDGAVRSGGNSSDVNCQARLLLSMPSAAIPDFKVQIDRVGDPFCRFSNDALNALAKETINKGLSQIKLGADAKLVNDEALEEFKKSPEVAKRLAEGTARGNYCMDKHNRQSICITFEWKEPIFKRYIDDLVAKAPSSDKAARTAGFKTRRAALRKASPRHDTVAPAYKFPSGVRSYGDMALFGGLLCASGEEEGCVLLRCSQGKTGQFWRSPAHVDQKPREGEAPFSGDQFKGVVGYFLARKTDGACPIDGLEQQTNRERFARYLEFIRAQRAPLPSPDLALDYGYRSCIEDPANTTCLLLGQEWTWLQFLAGRHNLADAIPADVKDPAAIYGYNPSHLEWLAAFAPLGDNAFQTHLVGVEIYLLRKAGLNPPTAQRAAAILAARQPKNPFYLYLHLGKKRLVSDQLREKCFSEVPSGEREEWAWQSDEGKKMWTKSEGWDCIFMLNNMLEKD